MKLLDSEQATQILLPKLSSARGRLTVGDASAATGMALEDARTALEALMTRYACRLQITESGEILYDFGASLRRRGEKSFAEVLSDLGAVAWRVLTILFKIWISVTLVVYFAVFVLILIAIIIALNNDSDGGFDFIGDFFGDLFAGIGRGMILVNTMDTDGYAHKSYRQVKRRDPGKLEKKKRFVQSVYDYVLGPPRSAFDPFANDKEVIAWLRQNNGILTTTEVVALAGWTMEEAEERFTDYLTRFKGTAEITDDGVLVGRFPAVMATGDKALEGGKVELFWDEFEAPYEVTGNTPGRNTFITCMNAFNLVWAYGFVTLDTTESVVYSVLPDWLSLTTVHIVLGWIPLIYSLAVFLLPAIRAMQVRAGERQRVERNKRRRVIRSLFDAAPREATPKTLLSAVNGGPQTPIAEQEFARLLGRVATDYRASVELTENGESVYRFDRIECERAAAAGLRSRAVGQTGPGNIIFDTGANAAATPLPG
jgi:hypothetical protein